MPRRKPGVLFESAEEGEFDSSDFPPDFPPDFPAAEPPVVPDKAPPKKLRAPEEMERARERKARRNADLTPRERARQKALKRVDKALDFFARVASGEKRPSKFEMEANEKILEIALDKTGTAQPTQSHRKRILVGFADLMPGSYPGGDPVTKSDSIIPIIPVEAARG